VNRRRLFTTLIAGFSAVVSSSFAYGLYLLVRVPRAAPAAPRSELQPPDLQALLNRAKDHLEKGEVEQALLAYHRSLFARPSLEAQIGLAEGEKMAGREDLAVDEFDRVLHLDARNATALLQLARIQSGKRPTWPDAEKHYRTYLAVHPDDPGAQLGLARLLAWQGRTTEALELYCRETVQARLTPSDRRDYALALVTAGRHAEAEPLLESILTSAPEDRDAALALAGIRASRGEWDSALPLYRALVGRWPDDPAVNLAYGQGLLGRGEHARALEPLGKAARARPSDADVALAYARAARGAGRLDLADAQFERAVTLDMRNASVAREYADLLMERRNYRKAEGLYRRAHASGLRDDRLLLAFGGALAANDKPKEAVVLLEEVYARQPSDRLAFELARLYRKLGRNDRALELLARIDR
jgi:tetratricopeptide (TPR) repeat protein